MFRVVLAASLALAVVPAAGVDSLAGTRAPAPSLAAAPELPQLLGFVDAALVRIDPESFRPLAGPRIGVGSGGCASRQGGTACWSYPPWTASPNGWQLVVARNDFSSLLLVDAASMRTTAKIAVSGGEIGALAWLAPGRLLAVQERPDGRQRLLALDLATRKLVARTALGGWVQQVVKTERELTILLAPAGGIGPSRIAVADRRGAVRFVRVARITAGSRLRPAPGHHVDARDPGLAVDPTTRRAFVVSDTLVAEVDLRRLSVSYHSLGRKPSLLRRLWSWLEPAASAKLVNGYDRRASWLGNGTLVVTGSDTEQGRFRPTGLRMVDTRSWNARTLHQGGTSFRITGDLVLAWGGVWDEAAGRSTGIGLAAYDLEGTERIHLFDGRHVWVDRVYDGRAYVGGSGGTETRIVDLATGGDLGTRQQPLPSLLLGGGDGWWAV
jgi:hypothetical protein